jgi:hypothetical protein
MFSTRFRHLIIAVCLFLQIMATSCLPCPCRQGKEESRYGEQMATSAPDAGSTTNTECLLCEAVRDIRLNPESDTRDFQGRLLAGMTQSSLPLLDDALLSNAVAHREYALPPADVDQAQVLLE